MKHTLLILIAVIALSSGCEEGSNSGDPFADAAKAEAKRRLESLGYVMPIDPDPIIIKEESVPGKNGVPKFRDNYGQWLHGKTTLDAGYIFIGMYEDGSMHMETLIHEFSHAYKVVNGYDIDTNHNDGSWHLFF